MNLTNLDDRAVEFQSRVDRLRGQVSLVETQVDSHAAELNMLTLNLDRESSALGVLQAIEQAWSKGFEQTLAETVSEGLSLVFGEPLALQVTSEFQRGQSAVTFSLLQHDNEATDIMEAEGGSVVNVASFLLRVLLLMAIRPSLRKTIILDEPFTGISMEHIPAAAKLLRKLVDESGLQIIMVTHEPALAEQADVVYEVDAGEVSILARRDSAHLETH